jgi:hypothetical protein
MQVEIKQNGDGKKTIPCDNASLIKVYGKSIQETDRKNILRIEMKDKNKDGFLSNPIISIYDKENLLFSGDAFALIKKLGGNNGENKDVH